MPTKDEMMKFTLEIESLVANTDYTYLEAIVEHCKGTGFGDGSGSNTYHSKSEV
jgi:hypothetical protein